MLDEQAARKISIQGIHVDITEAMRLAIAEKLSPLLRHNEHIVRLNLRLHRDQTLGDDHHYTATGQIEIRGPDLIAQAEGKDAYAVLDELAEKLDHMLERRHGRRLDKRNHPHGVELDVSLPKADDAPPR